MAQQKRNDQGNRNNERKNPNQDVQPWLGWVAAGIVVLIVVVAVAMGLERSNRPDGLEAEVSMTPIVGGMAVATAANESQAGSADDAAVERGEPDVTNMVTVTLPVTPTEGVTATDGLTDSAGLTESAGLTGSTGVTGTEPLTAAAALTTTAGVTVSAETTGSAEATVGDAITATEGVTQSVTPEPEPTATPTPRPSPTPTPTRSGLPPSFEVGDSVVNESDRVTLHADISQDSLVLDTINAGVAMTVIEPSGSDMSYPVENQGYGWVRVRSADGLVGWAITDGLSRVP